MGKFYQSTPLPINLNQAFKTYPELESAIKDLERLLEKYRETDLIFWQKFADLFTGPDDLAPAGDKAWSTLLRLRDLAWDGRLADDWLLRLEHNNSRAVLACNMLAIICKL